MPCRCTIFLELPFGFHINGQVCHLSVGIVEHSIFQYVLQYGFAILQYIAIRFLLYCCTPNDDYVVQLKTQRQKTHCKNNQLSD